MQYPALMNPSWSSLARTSVLPKSPTARTGLLIIGTGGANVGLLTLNRLILATGMYKFPYPVTTTFAQFVITASLVGGASWLAQLAFHGFPDSPDSEEKELLCPAPSDSIDFRKNSIPHSVNTKPSLTKLGWTEAGEVLPLAIVFVTKVLLENFFISQTQPPTFILLRISIIPWSLLLTPIVDRTPHSLLSIWSALLAGFSLLLASIPSERQITLGNTILGVLSSMFVAFFPVLLLRTYDTFCNSTLQRPVGSGFDPESGNSADELKQDELRVFWLVLRLTVWISTALLAVVLLFSGELPDILSNCYVLDTIILWCLIWGSGMLTGMVMILTLMLARRTSAAVATFLFVPESGLEILILNRFSITLSNWTDIIMCWFSSVCFMVERGKESTTKATGSAQRFYCALRSIILPVVVYACVHYIAHLSQPIFSLSLVSNHSSHIPLDLTRLNRTEIMYRAKDDYLGIRPHVDTVADLSSMVNRCNEIDGGKGVDDVVNCLLYLSSAEYLSLPAAGNGMRASEQDPRKADFVNADGHGNTLTQYIPPSQARAPTDTSIGTCAGPIIPFHVYWTGSASWRVELFIKAYLYTQNLPCSRLWLWVDCDIDSDCVDKMLLRDPIFQRFRPLVDRGDVVVKAWRFPLRIPLHSESNHADEANYFETSDPEAGGARVVGKGIYQDANGQQWLMLNPTHLAFSPVAVSDAVRFIVLHQHGGLYCDMDVLLMRDMRPLLLPDPVTGPRPFAEQWVERCPPTDYNTAVISLPANSSLSSYLLHGGLRMGFNFHPKAIGRMLWHDGRNGELKMLHNAVFDPLVTNLRREGTNTCTVPCHKNFHGAFMSRVEEASQEWSNYRGEPLPNPNVTSLVGDFGSQHWDLPPTNRTMENFFRGAWAYHIHNQWWKSPEPLSWMDVIMQAQNGFFDRRRMNLYGEYWNGPELEAYDTS